MTLLALHLIQNHAPSNLNRDDNGDPKDCLFGGVRRARQSSQVLKRSIRWSPVFRSYFADTPELLAQRTQLLPELVRKRLAGVDLADEVKQAIVEAAEKFGKVDRKSGAEDSAEEAPKSGTGRRGRSDEPSALEARRKTKQLMFLTPAEVDRLTGELIELYRTQGAKAFAEIKWDKFREDTREKYEPHAVDIAMFGRMTTSSPFKDIDAAVQVAHAISTHAVEQEFDFYTAVDDISGEAGAGFIGETTFNSATYYKYLSVHWETLVENLQDDPAVAAKAVRALIHAAVLAIPSGKQNGFAAHNLPDLVLVEVRPENIALSYANAFVEPVRRFDPERRREVSLLEASVQALQTYVPKINGMYGLTAQRAFLSTLPFELAGAQQLQSLSELLDWLPQGAGQGARR